LQNAFAWNRSFSKKGRIHLRDINVEKSKSLVFGKKFCNVSVISPITYPDKNIKYKNKRHKKYEDVAINDFQEKVVA
jgi:hypothetical protein